MNKVYLTTLNTDNYLPGVLVLAKNIKTYCKYPFWVLTSDNLKASTYEALKLHNIQYIIIKNMEISKKVTIETKSNPCYSHWANTLFKIRIFDLIQFDKIVYLDSDMMIQCSIDELFQKDDMSAVIAGKSFPGNEHFQDINSGLIVFTPDKGLSEKLIELIPKVAEKKKFFGDQDILTEYFNTWKNNMNLHLPEEYNVFFRYYDYYQRRSNVKVVHFIGSKKPWMINGLQIFKEYFKCILRGNFRSVGVLSKYMKHIKQVQSK